MLMPRKRTLHGRGRRMPRLAAATVPASILGILAVVAVAACGSPAPASHAATGGSGQLTSKGSGLCASTAQVTSLTVQRTGGLRGNHTRFMFPARETVSDAAKAQAVARNVCRLGQLPHTAVLHCPADFGIIYQLTFAAGSHRFTPVTVGATGCEGVSGLGAARSAVTSATFWRTLGTAIGIPQADDLAFRGTTPGS
jgi:hypothetical protein